MLISMECRCRYSRVDAIAGGEVKAHVVGFIFVGGFHLELITLAVEVVDLEGEIHDSVAGVREESLCRVGSGERGDH